MWPQQNVSHSRWIIGNSTYVRTFLWLVLHPAGMRCLWEISVRSPLREISQRPLRNMSKEMSFSWSLYDISNTSQKRCLFHNVSETSQKHLSQVFLVFREYITKILSCDFRRLITISDKIDVGPSETLKKWIILWEQCIDIKSAKWADIYVRDLASQGLSKSNSKCIIYYFQRFFFDW